MIKNRTRMLLEKQVSLDIRVRKEQFQASKDAKAQGLNSTEHNAFVSDHVTQYNAVELIRRSVRDVKKRAEEMDKLRRMQGSAYEGVKSKVSRNMKIVDRVNKVTRESCSPLKRPQTAFKMAEK